MLNLPLPLQALRQQQQLQSILWVQTNPSASSIDIQCESIDTVLRAEFQQRFDLVFVGAELFAEDKQRLLQLLAKARDLLSSRVVAERPAEAASRWPDTDFLALAMRRLAVIDGSQGEHVFYSYDLKTYKSVPDWLNARYWANPHMWEKARW